MSVRSLLQQALDASLLGDRIYSHWMRKKDIPDESTKEYIVYTVDSDLAIMRADGDTWVKDANPVVRYYHAFEIKEANVSSRETQIEDALISGGFTVTSGPFDAGDIDEVSMNTTIFECSYTRLCDGD